MKRTKAKTMKQKRYSFSVVGQGIMNPLYFDYDSFRVEIYDRKRKDGYAVAEASFLVPLDLVESLRAIFENYESDVMPVIDWGPLKPWTNAKGEIIQP